MAAPSSKTANRATSPAVKELVEKLAHDEDQHQACLEGMGTRYDAEGSPALAVATPALHPSGLTDHAVTARFREQPQGVAIETRLLSVGLALETHAIAHVPHAAQTADGTEVKESYRFLADWEKRHLDALNGLSALPSEPCPFCKNIGDVVD